MYLLNLWIYVSSKLILHLVEEAKIVAASLLLADWGYSNSFNWLMMIFKRDILLGLFYVINKLEIKFLYALNAIINSSDIFIIYYKNACYDPQAYCVEVIV